MNTIQPNFTINALLGCFVFWFTGLFASNAYALDPDDAINQFFDSPTVVQTRNYNVFSGGGFHMRIPRETAQLVNISPPRLSAGCSGIDATLGGFSFISADKFVQMLRSIMQNAQGYAIQIGITTLCPMCADIINKMEEVARMMNGFNIDSCKAAQGLVNSSLGGAEALVGTNLFGSEGSIASSIDTAAEPLSARIDSFMGGLTASGAKNSTQAANMTPSEARETRKEWYQDAVAIADDILNGKNTFDDGEQEKLQEAGKDASDAAIDLNILGYTDSQSKDFAMILLSISAGNFSETFPESQQNPDKETVTGVAKVKDVVNYFMYGLTPFQKISNLNIDASSIPVNINKKTKKAAYLEKRLLACPPGPLGIWNPFSCFSENLTKKTIEQMANDGSSVFGATNIKKGLYFFVLETLETSLNQIRAKKPLPKEMITLLNKTNQPVYKLLKIESIYPGAATSILNHYASLISIEITREIFESMVDDAEEFRSNREKKLSETLSKNIGLSGKVAKALSAVFNNINFREKTLETNLVQANALWQQIRTLEAVISRTASQQGVADKLMFSRSSPLTGR